jgi:PPK2 family polyphosphate:nucleotide phosphotransferase
MSSRTTEIRMSDAKDLMERLRVHPGEPAGLKDRDTKDDKHFDDEKATKARTKDVAKEINHYQDALFAEGRRSLLVILQGTDTSGKDGTIQAVFDYTSPLGVVTTAFKRPTEDELAHDYLWRVHNACPKRGYIGVFNRSHYEDVLVTRVNGLVSDKVVRQRFEQINAFEKMLTENGTTIVKFMLHISKSEQKERLQARLDEPDKNWKFNAGDLEDRVHWDAFEEAYEAALHHCSTEWAPWYVIPADRKWIRNAAVASIVRATLAEMDPTYPKVTWDPKSFKID